MYTMKMKTKPFQHFHKATIYRPDLKASLLLIVKKLLVFFPN